jgi:hypothetical protein
MFFPMEKGLPLWEMPFAVEKVWQKGMENRD